MTADVCRSKRRGPGASSLSHLVTIGALSRTTSACTYAPPAPMVRVANHVVRPGTDSIASLRGYTTNESRPEAHRTAWMIVRLDGTLSPLAPARAMDGPATSLRPSCEAAAIADGTAVARPARDARALTPIP